ncbi:MAG: hypothetical protein WAO58_01080 [Fimbriimonadaceae bacterium]
MPYTQKAPPISYAEEARLNRAFQSLSPEQRASLIAVISGHLVTPRIQSLQRRGQFLYVAMADDLGIYDFGSERIAQSCLTALTDCLRSQRAAVQMLMPVAPGV